MSHRTAQTFHKVV